MERRIPGLFTPLPVVDVTTAGRRSELRRTATSSPSRSRTHWPCSAQTSRTSSRADAGPPKEEDHEGSHPHRRSDTPDRDGSRTTVEPPGAGYRRVGLGSVPDAAKLVAWDGTAAPASAQRLAVAAPYHQIRTIAARLGLYDDYALFGSLVAPSFLLIGIAILLAVGRTGRWTRVVGVLTIIGMPIALISYLGYAAPPRGSTSGVQRPSSCSRSVWLRSRRESSPIGIVGSMVGGLCCSHARSSYSSAAWLC